jgi:hypothetical protein
MRAVSSTTPTITQATGQIYDILQHFSPEDRQKIIQAAFTLIGDQPPSTKSTPVPVMAASVGPMGHSDSPAQSNATATRWMQQHNLTRKMLEPYIHIDGDEAAVIGLPPTIKSRAERTTAAYLLLGVASLFASGSPSFADEAARQLCQEQGCYDQSNHAKICGTFGNRLRGSKKEGWRLTAPGLTAAADLIKATGD